MLAGTEVDDAALLLFGPLFSPIFNNFWRRLLFDLIAGCLVSLSPLFFFFLAYFAMLFLILTYFFLPYFFQLQHPHLPSILSTTKHV